MKLKKLGRYFEGEYEVLAIGKFEVINKTIWLLNQQKNEQIVKNYEKNAFYVHGFLGRNVGI